MDVRLKRGVILPGRRVEQRAHDHGDQIGTVECEVADDAGIDGIRLDEQKAHHDAQEKRVDLLGGRGVCHREQRGGDHDSGQGRHALGQIGQRACAEGQLLDQRCAEHCGNDKHTRVRGHVQSLGIDAVKFFELIGIFGRDLTQSLQTVLDQNFGRDLQHGHNTADDKEQRKTHQSGTQNGLEGGGLEAEIFHEIATLTVEYQPKDHQSDHRGDGGQKIRQIGDGDGIILHKDILQGLATKSVGGDGKGKEYADKAECGDQCDGRILKYVHEYGIADGEGKPLDHGALFLLLLHVFLLSGE